ncbi:MAG: hypothetical protein A3A26_01895 [Candidatus Zambryskibacteria bacterium RIFCSPLOWO2_01_FULL_47_14]|uniref:SCP domain-containing protein n=1 Tax=Candidatus Zambryskibacteria bacterium RIFCSPLOWO2_01_FULL_47_14 TaxID=1802763 RepID=A0A1G2U769_9BACT|nr:MAG: hypothetical protein A3A26_01895 [Candidatus Zambryskibacteria bacterium RIFCSPLOWO2_01_FULL_47_14]
MPILILLLIVGVTVFGNPTDNRVVYLKDASEETRIVENVALPFLPEKLLYDREAEQEIFSMVNVERKKAGLEDLVWDEEMAEVARAHSLDMWQRQYFAHENPDGETPLDRLLEDEIMLEKAGENLALARTIARAHKGLMDSPGHWRNILESDFGRIGIGVIDGGKHGKMVTQNFAD